MCLAGCVEWTVFNNYKSTGSSLRSDFRSASSCQNYCAQKDVCVAVEFNRNSGQCFVHTNIYNLAERNTRKDVPDVTQYRITRSCGTSSATTRTLTTGQSVYTE